MTMAKCGAVFVRLAHVFCLGCVVALEWTTTPQEHMLVCTGSSVEFKWDFKVDDNETIVSVNWIHDGAASSAVVATMVREHFMATNAFAGRVERLQASNGGLKVQDLRPADAGNYTLEVQVSRDSVFSSLKSTVNLQVADGLMLKGGQLTAGQDPDARWDEASNQWFIRLTCGFFTIMAQPSADVVWTTPDGRTVSSSGYESGRFYLSLTTPVQGGNYTCTIPPASLPLFCYREDGGHDSQVAFSAYLTVDERSAKFSLLEANQKTLLQDGARLREKLRTLKEIHIQELNNASQQCKAMMKDMDVQLERVRREWDSAKTTVTTLYKQAGLDVYSDDHEGPCMTNLHTILDEPWRSMDEDQDLKQCDKNLEVGWYRFLLNGQNSVMPRECVPINHCNTNAPIWLDLQGQRFPEVGQETEARACAHEGDDCCNSTMPVTVRNCGDYIVYYLQPVQVCSLAYCIKLQDW